MPASPLPPLPSSEALDLLEAALVRIVSADRLLRRAGTGLNLAPMEDAHARVAYRNVVNALYRAGRAQRSLRHLERRLEDAIGPSHG